VKRRATWRAYYSRRAEDPDYLKKERERSRRWREANPEKVQEINARRMFVCGMYTGSYGFTQREREAMVGGGRDPS
jgi:hypothetical protein